MSSPEPIRRSVVVPCEPQRAFDLFTEGMGTWWPLEDYSRAINEGLPARALRLEFQARPGGSILEHLSDGGALPWASVTEWEPPRRVVLAWAPHGLPEPPTDVEATFTAQAEGTRMDLEHRGWERLSEGFRDAMYEVYVRGWDGTLARYAEAASAAAAGKSGR